MSIMIMIQYVQNAQLKPIIQYRIKILFLQKILLVLQIVQILDAI